MGASDEADEETDDTYGLSRAPPCGRVGLACAVRPLTACNERVAVN